MNLLISVVVAGMIVVLFSLRRMVRKSGNPAVRAMLLTCLSLAIAVAIQLPAVYPAINSVAGFNLAWPLQHVLVIICAWFSQFFFLYSIEPDPDNVARQVARRAIFPALTILIVVGLFIAAPNSPDFVYGPDGRTEKGGAGNPVAQWAFIVYSAYLGTAGFMVMLLAQRWSKKASALPWLRAHLKLLALGLCFSALYCTHKIIFQFALLFGVNPPWREASIGNVLMAISAALVTIATSSSVLGSTYGARIIRPIAVVLRPLRPYWDKLVLGWWRYRARRALYPLWKSIYQAMPDIALDPPRSALADRCRLWSSGFHLYRFVIEIWDGHRHLSSVVPAHIRDLAKQTGRDAGLNDDELDATTEAVVIVLGLRAWQADSDTLAPAQPSRQMMAGQLSAEVVWWRRVSDAISHSPVVAEMLASLPDKEHDPAHQPAITHEGQ